MRGRALVLLALVAVGPRRRRRVLLVALPRAARRDASVLVEVGAGAARPCRPGPDVRRVAPVRGGLWLRSADPRFGGLSDLRVSPDGARLLAVSDCGSGFSASLTYDPDGRLAGLADARLVALGSGRRGDGRDRRREPRGGEEGLEVGFEGARRRAGLRARPALRRPASPAPEPSRPRACGWNGGLETMTATADGRRLLVCEARRGRLEHRCPPGSAAATTWTAREYPLALRRRLDGRAVPAHRRAPCSRTGDLLVVERRFPPVGVRVVRLSRGKPRRRRALRAARDRADRVSAQRRQLRGRGGPARRRLRPDARLPALRRQRLREATARRRCPASSARCC